MGAAAQVPQHSYKLCRLYLLLQTRTDRLLELVRSLVLVAESTLGQHGIEQGDIRASFSRMQEALYQFCLYLLGLRAGLYRFCRARSPFFE